MIAAIIGGATLQAAAEAAGVHRNTVAYWRRISLRFREALAHAQYEKAIAIREQAEAPVTDAWSAIHAILHAASAEPEAVYRMESIAIPLHKDAQTQNHCQLSPRQLEEKTAVYQ